MRPAASHPRSPHRSTALLLTPQALWSTWGTVALVLVLTVTWLAQPGRTAQAAATDLIFSEYVEGTGVNTALEIYNGTASTVDLSLYTVELYSGASQTPISSQPLIGSLASGTVFVIANPGAPFSANLKSAVTLFDGDDVIILRKGGIIVDSIGQLGGIGPWSANGVSTANQTLRRRPDVCAGRTTPNAPFDPSLEWQAFPLDTLDGLGAHTSNCLGPSGSSARINEFVVDHVGDDTNQFIEIFGQPNTNYADLTLLAIEGDPGSQLGRVAWFNAVGFTDGNGYWTTGYRTNQLPKSNVTILLVRNFSGGVGTDIDVNDDGQIDQPAPWSELIDRVAVSNGAPGSRTYSPVTLLPNFDGSNFEPGGASRIPNGSNTGNINDWRRNHFNGEGLSCAGCGGTAGPNEAVNTIGQENRLGGQATPPTNTPTPTPSGPTPTSTPLAQGCVVNSILNGGFETNDFWIFGQDPVPARYTGEQRRTGLRSVLMGNRPGPGTQNKVTYSSVRQLVSIPHNASTAALRWHFFPESQEGSLNAPNRFQDRQEVILLTPGLHTMEILFRTRQNAPGWQGQERDITQHVGKSFYVYFNVFNDGNGARTWMFLDDVEMVICYPEVTPTSTSPPTATATQTPTPSPTPTPSATPTPSETPMPSATPTQTPMPTLDVGSDVQPPGAVAPPILTREPGTDREGSIPPGCVELVVNGGFETPNMGWFLVEGPNMPVYDGTQAFKGGNLSLRLGYTPGGRSPAGVSQAEQVIDLPADYGSIVLSFNYFPVVDGPAGADDLQYVDIFNEFTGQFSRRVLGVQRNDRVWLFSQYDLTALAGQPIRLVLAVNNDGGQGTIGMNVDNVSILACDPLAPAAGVLSPAAATMTAAAQTVTSPTLPPSVTPTNTVVVIDEDAGAAAGALTPTPAVTSAPATGDVLTGQPAWLRRLGAVAVLFAVLAIIAALAAGIRASRRTRSSSP